MKRTTIDNHTGPWTYGIDVSAYQKGVDWDRAARSQIRVDGGAPRGEPTFCFVRLADGVQTRKTSKEDPEAVSHLRGAERVKMRIGGYHYARAFHGAEAQVALCLKVIQTSGVFCPIVAIDLEGRPDNRATRDVDESDGVFWHPPGTVAPTVQEMIAFVHEMVRLFLEHGVWPIIYSGVLWHFYVSQAAIQLPILFELLDLWTPDYRTGDRYRLPVGPKGEPYPWAFAHFHQCAGGGSNIEGSLDGIKGGIDVNRYRGDRDAMHAYFDATGNVPALVRARLLERLDAVLVAAKVGADSRAIAEGVAKVAELAKAAMDHEAASRLTACYVGKGGTLSLEALTRTAELLRK